MSDDSSPSDTPPRLSAAERRARETHGDDPIESFSADPRVLLVQSVFALLALPFSLGGAIGAAFTEGGLQIGLAVVAILFAWPTVLGFLGTLRLLAAWNTVALVYSDRVILQRGSSFEEARWDEIESVIVLTGAGDPSSVYIHEPGYPQEVWIATETPLANFHREWTEVRCKDGRAIRFPSTISGYDNLSALIQGHVSKRLLPKFLAAIEAGQTVEFGPYAVTKSELRLRGRKLPWANHGNTYVDKGTIHTIRKDDESFGSVTPTTEVPNVASLICIAYRTPL